MTTLRLNTALTIVLTLIAFGYGGPPPTAAAAGQEKGQPPADNGGKGEGKAPPAVSYSLDIRPILMTRCSGCHGPSPWWSDAKQKGLDVTTYESLMKGGKSGLAIDPGQPEKSLLVKYLESPGVSIGNMPTMPFVGKPLPREQIDLIKRWIQQGARKDEKPSRSVTVLLPNVQILNPKEPEESFVCRIPAESYATIRILDPKTGKVLSDRGGAVHTVGKGEERDLGSGAAVNDWLFWSLDSGHDNHAPRVTFPEVVDVELLVEYPKGEVWGAEFGVKHLGRSEYHPQSFVRNPVSLAADQKGVFTYLVDARADVEVEIARLGAKRDEREFRDRLNDIDTGLRKYPWDLKGDGGMPVKPGSYAARFRCQGRDTKRPLRDTCIVFEVKP